jgi:hypothetical protein
VPVLEHVDTERFWPGVVDALGRLMHVAGFATDRIW